MNTNVDYDIAVIGLGPVGAVMTGLLARHGLRVLAIEKDRDVFPLPRAAHIDHTGLRTIQEMGCLDELLAPMIRNMRLDLLNGERKVLATIPADQDSVSGLPTSVYFYQPEFDAVLRRTAAAARGVATRLGTQLTDIAPVPGSDDLQLRLQGPADRDEDVRVSWLVGCDGARSFVRETSGMPLKNLDFDEQWLVVDLEVDAQTAGLPTDHVIEVCDPARPCLSTPISHNRQRFEFMLLPGESAQDMASHDVVTGLLRPWLKTHSYQVQRVAVYTFHGVVAQTWRKGRVLIAGDAAHQTPPFLGQGMCAGMRDAANLAWKLARVAAGRSPQDLLDTYESERLPHAVKVVQAAIRIGKTICELDPRRAAERDRLLLADDQGMRANLAFSLPSLEQGPLVRQGGGSLFVQTRIDGQWTDDLIGPNFLVLAKNPAALGESAQWWIDEMDARVRLVGEFGGAGMSSWFDRYDAEVVVVRPDRYVLGVAGNLDTITHEVAGALAAVEPSASLAS